MGLYKTSIFSIFTFIWANDLKFCTRSYTSCIYRMMGLKFAKWWRHTLELYCRPSGTENSQLTTLSVLSVLGETSISLCGTRHSCPRPHGWFWSFRRFPRARNRRFVLQCCIFFVLSLVQLCLALEELVWTLEFFASADSDSLAQWGVV